MYQNGKRMMAWITKIDKVVKHPDADSLDICTVGGWQCVTKLGEFKPGDPAVYISIDSWVPAWIAPFLSKGAEPSKYNDVPGERLRTAKLRGQLSQGLLIPVKNMANHFPMGHSPQGSTWKALAEAETDVTEVLGIQKWEAPIAAQLAGQVRGNFPTAVPKTDQERCLSGETIVTTIDGDVTIKEICENKLETFVKSYNHTTNEIEFRKIIGHSIMTRKRGWLKVTTKSGKEIIMTNNHRVWVEDLMCYRLASDLKIGNSLKITQKD